MGTDTQEFQPISIIPCRCKSQFCEQCSIGIMVSRREELRPIVAEWKDARMVTFTLDRKRFESPQQAFDFVKESRGISRMVEFLDRKNLLHSRDWFCAVEFHKDEEGWPHWHLVLHAGYIDWQIIAERWGLGFIKITGPKQTESPEHAMNYATKYITKGGDQIVPEWIMNRKTVKLFQMSQGLLGKQRKKEPKKTRRTRKKRTIQERLEFCRSQTKVLIREPVRGGLRFKHAKTYLVPWEDEFSKMTPEEFSEMAYRLENGRPLVDVRDEDIPF